MGNRGRRGRGRLVLAILASAIMLCLPTAASAATGPAESGFASDSTDLAGITAVATSGHYAYTAASATGQFTVLDISTPTNPVVVASTPATNSLVNATNLTISGNHAYVVSKNRNGPKGSNSNDDGTGNSLTIVDISNPAQPAIVGTVTDPVKLFGSYGIAVAGNYAYIAAQGCLGGQPCPNSGVGNSFVVIDISSPTNPTIVANISNGALPAPFTGSNALDHATSVALSGNYAYVTASYSNRLTVVDISNPLSPKIVASILDNTRLNFDVDVSTQGRYAYVADQSSEGLAVIDISNPTAPQIVGVTSSSWLNGAYRVRVRGDFAYVAATYAVAAVAVDVSNPTAPRVAAGVYDPTHFNNTTGVDVDPTGRYQLLTSPRLSNQSGATYPPYPNQPGGSAVSGTLSVLTLDPKPITLSISSSSKPANPTSQTTASFSFATSDTVASLRCQLDGAPFGPCTSPTTQQYTSLGAGSHTFAVLATDAAGNTATASYTWVVNPPPVNTAPPTISGSPVQGSQLTASTGTWTASPAPIYSYQWEDCSSGGAGCTPISNATSSTYTLVAADVGSTIEVLVTAQNSQGSTAAASSPTMAVTAVGSSPANTAPPTISGSAVEAQVLAASTGAWTGSPSFSYQWQRCDQTGANCGPVSNATTSTYTIGSADVGSTLEITLTATNSSGSAHATSGPTAVVTSASGPVTPILDNFNRPNNTGPPGPNWTHMTTFSSSPSSDMLITSQQITGPSGTSADYFNASTFGTNSEVYLTVVAKPTADLDTVGLLLRYQNPSLSTSSGYEAFFINENGALDQYRILLRSNGEKGTTLASATGPELNPGDRLLFRAIGTTLELWRGSGTTWTRILSTTDSTIQKAGYLGLASKNGAVRLDDFGGGTLP